MYSDMSKRTNSMPSCSASWRVTSVLPTPVGPANRKLPIGLSGLPRPERAILIAVASRHLLLRDARHSRDDVLDLVHIHFARALVVGQQALVRTRLVDHVDGL